MLRVDLSWYKERVACSTPRHAAMQSWIVQPGPGAPLTSELATSRRLEAQVVRTTTQALLVLTDRLSALDMVLSCGARVMPVPVAALALPRT